MGTKALWTVAFPEQVKDDHRDRLDARTRRYRRRAVAWRRANRKCVCCPIAIAGRLSGKNKDVRNTTSVHHWAGRDLVRDGLKELDLLFYEPYWLPVCTECHDLIHTKKDWSRSKGLLAPVGEWNAFPKNA